MTGLFEQVVALHRALTTGRVPHAFGGAIALAYCINQARATSDIDVNVFVPPEEATRVFEALPRGVKVRQADRRAAARDGQVRLRWASTPVDIFFAYHRFHEHAASRCREVPLGDVMIPVLGCTDLTVFKAFFARTRDWADIESMAAAGTIDGEEALGWVTDLLGEDADQAERLDAILRSPPQEGPPPRLPGR